MTKAAQELPLDNQETGAALSREIDRTFAWWTAALAGVRGPIDADNPKAGFYFTKSRDKKSRTLFAYWYDSHTGELRCHRGGNDLDDMQARETWPHASKNPITEEPYFAVFEGHPWPDEDKAVTAHNEILTESSDDPVAALAAEIAAATASIATYTKIESDEEATKAQSLRAHLTVLKGSAEKAHKVEKEPHLEAGREVDRKWFPLRDEAESAVKTIRKSQEAWEDFKRESARKAQAETDRITREHAEAVRKAAEANKPPPAPIATPVVSNIPAPSAQIKGGAGRAASVSVWNEVVIDDEAAV